MNELNRLIKYFIQLQDLRSTHHHALFILLNFFYCSQAWQHCGARNTRRLKKVNERTPRFICKDISTSHLTLLKQIGFHSNLETLRNQDIL